MQPRHHQFPDAQPLLIGVGVALCVVTAIIMGFVRVATTLALFGSFAALIVGVAVVLWLVGRYLDTEE
jgi:hypothetical protein